MYHIRISLPSFLCHYTYSVVYSSDSQQPIPGRSFSSDFSQWYLISFWSMEIFYSSKDQFRLRLRHWSIVSSDIEVNFLNQPGLLWGLHYYSCSTWGFLIIKAISVFSCSGDLLSSFNPACCTSWKSMQTFTYLSPSFKHACLQRDCFKFLFNHVQTAVWTSAVTSKLMLYLSAYLQMRISVSWEKKKEPVGILS